MSAKTTPKGLKEVTYNDAVARSKEYFGGDELAATVWVSKYALKDSFGHIYESSPEDMHHRIAAEIERIEKNYPNPSVARRDIRAARPLPLRHPAGRPDDRYRQQSANRFAVELLRHRSQEARRLLRRHHPHGRGAGADHETARRRGTRSLAPAPPRAVRAQLGAHVDGYRPLHGALLQLDARGGAGRPPRCADADHLDQAPPTPSASSTPRWTRRR